MPASMDLLGSGLRRRRAQRGLSLSEVARTAGVSKSTLSELERGRGNPSLDTLWSLAAALNVPFAALFEPKDSTASEVVRFAEARIVGDEEGMVSRHLLSRPMTGDVEIFVTDLEARASHVSRAHAPGVVEHAFVATGAVNVGPDPDAMVLQAGDITSFAADRPHRYEALDGAARLLVVVQYP